MSTRQRTMRQDVTAMRTVLAIVPWRMRYRILLLLAASLAVTALDMAAVALMLPLMQILASGGEVPGWILTRIAPVVGTADRDRLLLIIAMFVGSAFLLKNLALIGIRWWSLGLTSRASAVAQAEMLDRYVAADYAQHRRRSKALVLQTISGAVPSAFGSVLLGYVSLAVDGMTIVLLFATLVVMAPLASLVAIVVFGGATVLLGRVLKPAALRFGRQGLQLEMEAYGQLNPAVEGFRETRIFRREALFADRYRANRERYAVMARSQGILGELPKYLLEVVMIAGIILIAILLFVVYDETTAFGLLAVFAAAAVRIVPALNRVLGTVNGIRSGQPYLDRAAEQIRELEAEEGRIPREQMRASRPAPPRADIVIDDVSYRYPGSDRDVLTGVSARIPRGGTVALVGASGAGKSTFADLLTGLTHPTAGSITVGDLDVAEDPRRWMQGIAVVSQKVYLWDASVRDLITFGQDRDEVDEALLTRVLHQARLTELVAELPEGLDSTVGEGGTRLSGGQAQRLGIARALYARPEVLILDEATSALDNQTEHEITRMLEELRGEITVVVIAHRLSTVKSADEILFFSGGRLAARGTMPELVASTPEFARLVELGSLT